jgi:uncharacterized protein (TIGR00369 family)
MKIVDAIQKIIAGEDVPGIPFRLPPPVAKLIGFQPVSASEGATVFRMTVDREKHANPMGTLHGGILCDIADGAMGMACATLLEPGESFTTLELKTNFFRPVIDGEIEARAKVVHRGKSLVYLECDVVTLPEGKLVAKSSSTCTILRGAQAAGR